MYDEKVKTLKVDKKSLLIKFIILLVIVFLIMWIISLFKNNKQSNINENFDLMKEAALNYFSSSKLPTQINTTNKLTLQQMQDEKLVYELKNEDKKACDSENSYAEVTKTDATTYLIKIDLVCGEKRKSYVDTFYKEVIVDEPIFDDDYNNSDIDQNIADNTPSPDLTENNQVIDDNSSSNNSNQHLASSTNQSSSTSSSKKPTSSSQNNSASASSTPTQSLTTSKPQIETQVEPQVEPQPEVCNYGSLNYYAQYPMIYALKGNCAASKDDYMKAEYVNIVNDLSTKEYKKLYEEISALQGSTDSKLEVLPPVYNAVYNKEQTGLVGYQAIFKVVQKLPYRTKTIYEYYLSEDGSRKAIIDVRYSLESNIN